MTGPLEKELGPSRPRSNCQLLVEERFLAKKSLLATANDSVDHQWLRKMLTLHRLPEWIGKVVYLLNSQWNTQIVARTK